MVVVFDFVVVNNEEEDKGVVVAAVYRVREEMAAEEATVTDRLGCCLQMQCPKNKLFCAEPNNAQVIVKAFNDTKAVMGVIERDSKLPTHLMQRCRIRQIDVVDAARCEVIQIECVMYLQGPLNASKSAMKIISLNQGREGIRNQDQRESDTLAKPRTFSGQKRFYFLYLYTVESSRHNNQKSNSFANFWLARLTIKSTVAKKRQGP